MKEHLHLENWWRGYDGEHFVAGLVDGAEHKSAPIYRFEPDKGAAESHVAVYTLGKHAKRKDDGV
jgi:hypothetical protein